MSYHDRQPEPPTVSYRSSYDAVGSTLQELEDLKEQGIFGLMRLRWEAWLAERAAGHIERREKSKQIALAAKRKSVEEGMATARAVEAMQIDNDRQVIAAIESGQRRMIAEASLTPGSLVAAPRLLLRESVPPQDAAPVRPYLTDAQIDAIARRFLAMFPVGDDFEAAWLRYAATLESAVPVHAHAEIRERAAELLKLAGNG